MKGYRDLIASEIVLLSVPLMRLVGQPIEILDNGYNGYLLKELPGHTIEVHRMIVNWRLARLPKRPLPVADRYWCYASLEFGTLVAATLAGLAWDGGDDTEPEGWVKNGQTGEFRQRAEYPASWGSLVVP